jgi:hypothetical protein
MIDTNRFFQQTIQLFNFQYIFLELGITENLGHYDMILNDGTNQPPCNGLNLLNESFGYGSIDSIKINK